MGSYSYLSLRFQGKELIEHVLWAHRQSRLTGNELQASQVPPGLVGGGDLRGGRHRNTLGLATPNLDRDRRAEGLTVGVTESEVHLVDCAIGLDVRTHGDGEREAGSGVSGNLVHASSCELRKRHILARLLTGESDLAISGVGLVRVVHDCDGDLVGSTWGHLNLVLGLASDNCAILLRVFVLSALFASHLRLIVGFLGALLAAGLLLLVALGELSAELTNLLTQLLSVECTLFVGAILLHDLLHGFASKGSHARAAFLLSCGGLILLFLAVLLLAGLVLSGSLLGSDFGANVLNSLDHFVFVANVFESSFDLLLFSLLIS